MTLLDRVRNTVRPHPRDDARDHAHNPARDDANDSHRTASTRRRWERWITPGRRVVALGAVAALGSWLGVLVLVSLGWALTPQSGGGIGDLCTASAGLWLLATGASVQVAGPAAVPVGLVPLLAWALALWLAGAVLTRARQHLDADGFLALAWRFLVGYAVALAALALLAASGPIQATPSGLTRALLIPLAVLAHDVLRDPPQSLADRLPSWLDRAWRPAMWGLAALGVAGLTLTVAAVLIRRETVSGLYAAAGADGTGGLLLTMAQLLFAPDFVLWAIAFLAGPGFQITAQGSITVAGATPGLVPLVPVLGALPSEADFGGWVRLATLIPVLAGVLIGRAADHAWPRPAHWSGPVRTAAAAAALAAAGVGLLTWLGSGPVGVERLAHVGPRPLPVSAALFGELALGAAAYLVGRRVRDGWADPGVSPRDLAPTEQHPAAADAS